MYRVALIFLLLTGFISAQSDFSVNAEVSAKKIGFEDLLIYTVVLNGEGRAPAPSIGHIKDFRLIQTSNSQSFQFINGAASYQIKYQYYLKPLKRGVLSIPKLKYKYKGKSYTTEGFRIHVVKGSVQQKNPSAARSRIDSFFNDGFPSSRRRQAAFKASDVKVKVTVSKKNPVVGEQVICRVKLYTLAHVSRVGLMSSTTFPGFWIEWIEGKKRLDGSREVINGKAYQVYELSKLVLFPSKSGKVEIPPFKYQMLVSTASGFGFIDRPREVVRETKGVTLNVKDLPVSASGLPVGKFRLTLLTYKKAIDINDILTLKYRLSGQGNIKTIDIPQLEKSENYRLYPAKISRSKSLNGNLMSGRITAEIPVSFNKAGKHKLPSLKFRYYDNLKAKVMETTTPPVEVEVTGVKEGENQAGGVLLVNQDIKKKGEDIKFIVKGEPGDRQSSFYKSALFWWLIFLPFAALAIAALKIYVIDPRLTGSRRPEKRIFRETLISLKECSEFGEICSILDRYIAVKTGTGNSAINREVIDSIFEKHGVGTQDSRQFIDIRSKSESFRYSGGEFGREEMGKVVDEIVGVVERVNRKIK